MQAQRDRLAFCPGTGTDWHSVPGPEQIGLLSRSAPEDPTENIARYVAEEAGPQKAGHPAAVAGAHRRKPLGVPAAASDRTRKPPPKKGRWCRHPRARGKARCLPATSNVPSPSARAPQSPSCGPTQRTYGHYGPTTSPPPGGHGWQPRTRANHAETCWLGSDVRRSSPGRRKRCRVRLVPCVCAARTKLMTNASGISGWASKPCVRGRART